MRAHDLRDASVARLVDAAKAIPVVWGDLNDCVFCGVIFMSRYGVKYKASHRRTCRWAKLQRAAKRLEQRP